MEPLGTVTSLAPLPVCSRLPAQNTLDTWGKYLYVRETDAKCLRKRLLLPPPLLLLRLLSTPTHTQPSYPILRLGFVPTPPFHDKKARFRISRDFATPTTGKGKHVDDQRLTRKRYFLFWSNGLSAERCRCCRVLSRQHRHRLCWLHHGVLLEACAISVRARCRLPHDSILRVFCGSHVNTDGSQFAHREGKTF